MTPVKLSVICVTYNDIDGIVRTLSSLEKLVLSSGGEVEVLVQDGGTGEELLRAISKFSWALVESQADSGVYDGMNKGMNRAEGSALWFLNGGDESLIHDWKTVSSIPGLSNEILYFNYIQMSNARRLSKKSRPLWYIRHALPTSHQAIIYPFSKENQVRYPIDFSVVGDYAFTAKLIKAGVIQRRVGLALSIFHLGGLSTDRAWAIGGEATLVQKTILGVNFLSRWMSRAIHWSSAVRHRFRANRK